MLVEIIERRPAQRAVLTVNTPRFRLQLMTNVLIGLHIATRRRSNLRIADFATVFREVFQQRFIRQETFRQAFGIIETLTGNNVFRIAQLALHRGHFWRQRAFSHLFDAVRLNADRINLGCEGVAKRVMQLIARAFQLCQLGQAINERHAIVFGLEAQQIVVAQHFQQLFVRRQRVENLWRRERNVQEEADAVSNAQLAQRGSKRQQMIIVDPQNIVRLNQRLQAASQLFIDVTVTFPGFALELHQIETVMEGGPDYRVGELAVVKIVFVLIKRERGIGDAIVLDDAQLFIFLFCDGADFAIPAKPQSTGSF